MEYEIYTDGSCKPTNPGYCGSGIVFVMSGQAEYTISEFLGKGTNNIAELTAIKLALLYLKEKELEWESHTIYTDSNYAVGLLIKNWKPSKNKELVKELKALFEEFPNTELKWIKGHNNDEFNEMADELANQAVDDGIKNEVNG